MISKLKKKTFHIPQSVSTRLADGLLHFVLVLQHADHVDCVLDDERHDGDEGQAEHLRQVDLLAAPGGRVQAAASCLHLQQRRHISRDDIGIGMDSTCWGKEITFYIKLALAKMSN